MTKALVTDEKCIKKRGGRSEEGRVAALICSNTQSFAGDDSVSLPQEADHRSSEEPNQGVDPVARPPSLLCSPGIHDFP